MITRADSVKLYNLIMRALTDFFEDSGTASLDDIENILEKVYDHLYYSGQINIPEIDGQDEK